MIYVHIYSRKLIPLANHHKDELWTPIIPTIDVDFETDKVAVQSPKTNREKMSLLHYNVSFWKC